MSQTEKHQKYLNILRLLAEGGFTYQTLCESYGVSRSTVYQLKAVMEKHNLGKDALTCMNADDLGMYLEPRNERVPNPEYLHPDFEELSRRLKYRKHYTRQLAWEDYRTEAKRMGLMFYSYQAFCKKFNKHMQVTNTAMSVEHKPGQKVYIDWVGDIMYVHDPDENKRRKVYIIVFTLPYSGYTFARGYYSMNQASWLDSHIRAMEFFGGVPRLWVPDNCATATERKRRKFDPIKIIKDYQFLADKYSAAILPTPVRMPTGKATVERHVEVIETRFCAKYAEDIFYSLDELNEVLEKTIEDINNMVREDTTTRYEVFVEDELKELLELPDEDLQAFESKDVKVNKNYHIQLNKKYYSVPYIHVGKKLRVHYTPLSLAIYEGTALICTHSITKCRFTTLPEHMPPNHLKARGLWSKEGMLERARHVGPSCFMAINHLFKLVDIEEQCYLDVQNIFGLIKKYSPLELEYVCDEFVTEGAKITYQGALERLRLRAKEQQEIKDRGLMQNTPLDFAESKDAAKGLTNSPDSYAL